MDDRFKQHATNKNSGNLTGIRESRESDRERIFSIWCSAVDATHHFLRPADRRAIESEVAAILSNVLLWLAVNDADEALGFMLLNGSWMEALFIDPLHRGSGIGRALVQHALKSPFNHYYGSE
jgi:putative acetyltransferase